MKKIILLTLFACGIGGFNSAAGQGWVAEVDLDLNHELYAYEKISDASFSYSGVTMTGSSPTSTLQLIIKGTGPITGEIKLAINGVAWDPYYAELPYIQAISAMYSGNSSALCATGFFASEGASAFGQVNIRMTVYPQLEITDFINSCDELSFSTTSCSPTYTWEASESLDGSFKVIPGKSTASISITRDDLMALGFKEAFGRKYFRVTGRPGTTSLKQPMDIYYPPPTASILAVPPKCHDGEDGSVKVDIRSAGPAMVNDFVVTLFSDESLKNGVAQDFVNDAFTFTFSGLSPGNYWVKIENNTNIAVNGNCAAVYASDELINPSKVHIAALEVSDYNGYPLNCDGGNDGTIRATPAGGTGSYISYEWTPAVATNGFAQNLSAGTYAVRVEDSNHCWSERASQTLEAPEKLSVQLISTGGKNGFGVSCTDKKDGMIETSVSGGVLQYHYFWSSGETTPTLSNVGAARYEVTITDDNGCVAGQAVTLAAPEPINFTIAEISGITCAGDRSGLLAIRIPLNTIGAISYAWSSGETGVEITDKPAGTYSATVSDDQGCSATRYHTLVEPPSYTLDIIPASDYSGSPIRCNGEDNGRLDAIMKDENGNVVSAEDYTWYQNGAEFSSGAERSSLDGLPAGSYATEVTYRTFCKAKGTFLLREPEAVSVEISDISDYNGLPISCHGKADGSITAAATGGTGLSYSYVWDSGQIGEDLSSLAAGTYVVTARDMNGCEGRSEKILHDPDPVEVIISVRSDFNGMPVSCSGESDARLSALATGGASGFSYTWNTGEAGPDLADISAGNYIVTATDRNGCAGVTDATLADPLPVEAVISKRSDYNGFGVSCQGSQDGFLSCEASGGTGNFEFTWTETSYAGPLYDGLSSGIYAVTVKDDNGCSATAMERITGPPALSLGVAGLKNVSCHNGQDGEIQLLATGGAGGYRYSIDERAWQDSAVFTELKARTYILKLTDANGCLKDTTGTLSAPAALSISFDDIQPALCSDPTGQVSAKGTGGTGAYTYEWTGPGDAVFSAQPDVTGLSSGVYTLKITDDNSCQEVRSVGITAEDGPTTEVSAIQSASCFDATDGSAEIKVTGGQAPFTFLWQNGQQTAEATNLGRGHYLVEITDTNHCTAVETVTIIAPDSLKIELVEKVAPSCHGDSNGRLAVIANGGNGNYAYEWENFAGTTLTGLSAGSYQVKVTDEKKCVLTEAFVLEQPQPVFIGLNEARPPVCHDGCNGKLDVTASGGSGRLHYEWSGGEKDPLIENLCPGAYTVTVIDANDCAAERTFLLENPVERSMDLGGSITLCAGQSHTLDPGSYWESYSWSANTGYGSTAQRITISEAGMYWLAAEGSDGCVSRDTFLLETSTDLLKANFLLTTTATAGDTVVIIDISWPLPEHILWALPSEMTTIDDLGDIVYGRFEHAGAYEISLAATLGECHDEMTKTITVIDEKENSDAGRLGYQAFVKEFNLYPNPNDGTFDAKIELAEESPLVLTVWNILTGRKIARVDDRGQSTYLKHFDLRPLSAGSYSLRLDYGRGTKYIRFIVR